MAGCRCRRSPRDTRLREHHSYDRVACIQPPRSYGMAQPLSTPRCGRNHNNNPQRRPYLGWWGMWRCYIMRAYNGPQYMLVSIIQMLVRATSRREDPRRRLKGDALEADTRGILGPSTGGASMRECCPRRYWSQQLIVELVQRLSLSSQIEKDRNVSCNMPSQDRKNPRVCMTTSMASQMDRWWTIGLLGRQATRTDGRPCWRSIVSRVTRVVTRSCVGIPYRCASDQARQVRWSRRCSSQHWRWVKETTILLPCPSKWDRDGATEGRLKRKWSMYKMCIKKQNILQNVNNKKKNEN